jgi:beta-barrel assembly-enhancing protease
MKRLTLTLSIAFQLVASHGYAEKLKGFLLDVSPTAIVVEGQTIRLTPDTDVDRANQKDITAKDLRIGWEVEVETKGAPGALVAKRVLVKNARFQEEKIEGIVEGVAGTHFNVDGDEIRLPSGSVPAELKAGMRFKGKGVRQDDRSILLKEGQIIPAGFVGEEAQFMAAVSQEMGKVRSQLKTVKDPALQAYVERVGRSLVPKWVDSQQFQFTFTLVDDPSLNAFAMPDGTVVVHSGLLAALENEAQLATVLGHEIAHATHRHGYRGFKDQQKKQMWIGLASLGAGIALGDKADSPWVGIAAGLGTNLTLQAMVNGHGRKLEDEADIVGLHYMTDAGYDYMQAPEVWRVFGKYSKDQGRLANFFFGNHSTHAARINNLTKEINADYRTQVPREALKTNAVEYQKVAENVRAMVAKENAAAAERKEKLDTAQRGLAASLERNPNDARAHHEMAKVLWLQGGQQNAQPVMQHMAAAIQLEPSAPEPWRDVGLLLAQMGDNARAVQAFQQYMTLAPNAPEAPKLREFITAVQQQAAGQR